MPSKVETKIVESTTLIHSNKDKSYLLFLSSQDEHNVDHSPFLQGDIRNRRYPYVEKLKVGVSTCRRNKSQEAKVANMKLKRR